MTRIPELSYIPRPYKSDGAGGSVSHPVLPSFPSTTSRINAAKSWINTLYQSDGYYGYIKEHPGLPLSIYCRNIGDQRHSGDYRKENWLSPYVDVSRVSDVEITGNYDITSVGMEDEWDEDYNEPLLTATRTYYESGSTYYRILLNKFDGDSVVDVYLGDRLLWADVKTKYPGSSYTVPSYYYQGLPCNKYALRHANRLGSFIYAIWGDYTKSDWLEKLRSDYGFTHDIYDPMFGVSAEQVGDFMFRDGAYPDTRDVWETLPRGMNPHRNPYFSKVQINRILYLIQSRTDSLLRMLQAIHILNKTGNPDYRYNRALLPLIDMVTPADVGRESERLWNDLGIPHPSDNTITSGVRTAAYITLATLLGYKYGVTEMREAADEAFWAVTGVNAPQAGMYPLYSSSHITTIENGVLVRPPYRGAFYNLYASYKDVGVAASNAPSSILDPLIDMFNMPAEDAGPVPSNAETTMTMIQALRVYLRYAQGVNYPSSALLP